LEKEEGREENIVINLKEMDCRDVNLVQSVFNT